MRELSWKSSALIKIFEINFDDKKRFNKIGSSPVKHKTYLVKIWFWSWISPSRYYAPKYLYLKLSQSPFSWIYTEDHFFPWLFYKWSLRIVLIQKWGFWRWEVSNEFQNYFFKQKSKKLSILTPLDITIIWTCHRDGVVQSRNFGWFLRFHFKPQRKNIFLRYLT